MPKIYAYSTQQVGSNSPFIAMKYMEGQPLDAVWNDLSQAEKKTVIDEIARTLVAIGEINLGGIGGMTLDHVLGPTGEGIKLFGGRVREPRDERLHPSAFS